MKATLPALALAVVVGCAAYPLDAFARTSVTGGERTPRHESKPTVIKASDRAAQPLFKVGLLSDTHVRTTLESCSRLRAALGVFRRAGVDLICNLGDVAECHYPEAYRLYRETFDGVFGTKKPREAYVYAWHDACPPYDLPPDAPRLTTPEAFADMKARLGVPNETEELFGFRGYPFVVVSQYVAMEKLEELVMRAEREFPGKPVFVLDHVPPYATSDNSYTWGDVRRRNLLERHPRVVHLDGHTHGSLRNEQQIWQGAFTCVNACCLQVWDGELVGAQASGKQAYGCLVMEVFPDALVFRRYDVRDGSEFGTKEPWTVPLPFDPKTAPYRAGARILPPLTFAADAALAFAQEQGETVVTVPSVNEADLAYVYRFELLRDGRTFAVRDRHGEFYLRPADRTGSVSCAFDAAYFEPSDKMLSVRVTPIDFFGRLGQPLVGACARPKPPTRTTVFDSSDPTKDCQVFDGGDGLKPLQTTDGVVAWNGGSVRFRPPAEIWGDGKKTAYRLVLDIEAQQPKHGGLKVSCRTFDRTTGKLGRIRLKCRLLEEDGARRRYVLDMRKSSSPSDAFEVVFGGKLAGMKVRVCRFKVIRL